MSNILEVKNLKTSFYSEEGIIKAVDGVSFSLAKGETLGIIGESGSGKTVTALSILRLISWPPGKIISGSIILDGKDIMELPNRDLVKIRGNEISMIFQDPMTSLNPVFTIGNQIIETILLHNKINKEIAKEKAISLLKDVGIPDPEIRFSQYPHEYSGGMRQRAMIAMALACNPKVLIADEPTTALDVTIQAQILKLLKKMRKELNNSMIFITHDLPVIAEVSDNIMVMYAGKILEYGDLTTILYTPVHPYTIALLKSIPHIEKRVRRLIQIEGNPPSLTNLPHGCSFNIRCKHSKSICFENIPELRVVHNNHKVACHLSLEEINSIKEKLDDYTAK